MKLFDKEACLKLLDIGGPFCHQTGVPKYRYNQLTETEKPGYECDTDNLGYGYFYYGIVRIYKPRVIVCIGSGFGFVPMCLALAARDNNVGRVHFVDPSYHRSDCWSDPHKVKERFESVGLNTNWITHYKLTNREFFKKSELCKAPPEIDLLFIDGSDKKDDVEFDFKKIGKFVKPGGFILVHDTAQDDQYHEPRLVHQLRKALNCYDIIRFPGKAGFSLIRKLK